MFFYPVDALTDAPADAEPFAGTEILAGKKVTKDEEILTDE